MASGNAAAVRAAAVAQSLPSRIVGRQRRLVEALVQWAVIPSDRASGDVEPPRLVRIAGEPRRGAKWIVEGIGPVFERSARKGIIGNEIAAWQFSPVGNRALGSVGVYKLSRKLRRQSTSTATRRLPACARKTFS